MMNESAELGIPLMNTKRSVPHIWLSYSLAHTQSVWSIFTSHNSPWPHGRLKSNLLLASSLKSTQIGMSLQHVRNNALKKPVKGK